MRKKMTPGQLPEIVFGSSQSYTSRQISKLVKEGHLRKLIPRVYTSNMHDPGHLIVKRNLWQLISHLFPGAILSHRSAIEFRPSKKGNVYLTWHNKKVYDWHNIKIKIAIGPKSLPDDYLLYEQLYASSLERAMLENLRPSRLVDGERRILKQEKIEERLLLEFNTKGESGLNQLRDRAREIAQDFGWSKAYKKLDLLIGSLLSSRPQDILKSPLALAQVLGEPYDSGRMYLFQKLIAALNHSSLEDRPQKTDSHEPFTLIAFFESYFSNYIEGTTFEIQEAIDILYHGKIIPNRSGDTHDIQGTYQLVSDRFEMSQIPHTPEAFIDILRRRHRIIMKGRKEKHPGTFKRQANRAGDSFFVSPEMVYGTLKQGFKLTSSLGKAWQRALYMMFLVSEVHPFDDGNGRLARVMMNSELVHAKKSKLIIPTVYRDDYMLNLKKLTRQGDPQGYIRMMERAYAFGHWLEPSSFYSLQQQLEESNAFKESDQAVLRFSTTL